MLFLRGQDKDTINAKQYISFMVTLLMTAGLLQSCGNDQPDETTSGQGDTDIMTVEAETSRETPAVTQADFSSMYAKYETKAISEVEKINGAFAEIN